MRRFWKGILCLLCSCCFCSSIKADNLDWMSHTYLSDKKYAKNIEVKAYLVTREQVVQVFSNDTVEITQKPNKELYGREIFLLIRCKNFGDYQAFGALNCKIPSRGNPVSIEIMVMPGYMKFYKDCVIPMSSGIIPNDDNTPMVSCEWNRLYTI